MLYNGDTNELLTTRTYDSYDEAAEDANQVDDILVLPLVFEEIHAYPPIVRSVTPVKYTLHIDGNLFRYQREC